MYSVSIFKLTEQAQAMFITPPCTNLIVYKHIMPYTKDINSTTHKGDNITLNIDFTVLISDTFQFLYI